MRPLVVGLIGVVLGVGAAQAGECRPGHVAFVEQANENRPGDLLTVEVRDFSSVTKKTTHGPFHTMSARGSADGKQYFFELLAAPHMLGSTVSYEGELDSQGPAPQWGAPLAEMPWKDGETFPVTAGPLKGPWMVRCSG